MAARVHLEGPVRCGQVGGTETQDIVQADCRTCLWRLAKVTHMQLAAALKRMEELEGVVVESPPAGAKRRG
jgi:hypothetical protein